MPVQKFKIALLKIDDDLYPRASVNRHNVIAIKEAYSLGKEVPLIIADKKTKIIIDGQHRRDALLELYGPEVEYEVDFRSFKDKQARFNAAMEANAEHGMRLSRYDYARCLAIGMRLHISKEEIAKGLGVRVEFLEKATKARFDKGSATKLGQDEPVPTPLKRSIKHMSESTLSNGQRDANDHLSGWSLKFHCDQILLHLRNGFVDAGNETDMKALEELSEELERLFAKT